MEPNLAIHTWSAEIRAWVRDLGFPIVVATVLLIRIDNTMRSLELSNVLKLQSLDTLQQCCRDIRDRHYDRLPQDRPQHGRRWPPTPLIQLARCH